jgi:flagellar biosynthesis/type III secretory pathway protein FliH
MTSLYRLIRRARVALEPYQVRSEGGVSCALPGKSGESEGCDEEAVRLESAYKAGHDAGFNAAKDQMRQETEALVGRFTSMIDDLSSQRRALIKESETAVLKLVCEIVRKVIGKVVEIDNTAVRHVVSNALKQMDDQEKLIVRLNPDDLAALKQHEAAWAEDVERSGVVELKSDARIKRGGCLVDGESGSVEAQVERQIGVIERALSEAAR